MQEQIKRHQDQAYAHVTSLPCIRPCDLTSFRALSSVSCARFLVSKYWFGRFNAQRHVHPRRPLAKQCSETALQQKPARLCVLCIHVCSSTTTTRLPTATAATRVCLARPPTLSTLQPSPRPSDYPRLLASPVHDLPCLLFHLLPHMLGTRQWSVCGWRYGHVAATCTLFLSAPLHPRGILLAGRASRQKYATGEAGGGDHRPRRPTQPHASGIPLPSSLGPLLRHRLWCYVCARCWTCVVLVRARGAESLKT
jgi:hypothetical protein